MGFVLRDGGQLSSLASITQGRVGSYTVSSVDRTSKAATTNSTLDTKLLVSGYCPAPLPSQKSASLSHHCHDALGCSGLLRISCPPTSGPVVTVPGSSDLAGPSPDGIFLLEEAGCRPSYPSLEPGDPRGGALLGEVEQKRPPGPGQKEFSVALGKEIG